MTRIRKPVIGYMEHRAFRGAYRTFCGKSVELAGRHKPIVECPVCRESTHNDDSVVRS